MIAVVIEVVASAERYSMSASDDLRHALADREEVEEEEEVG